MKTTKFLLAIALVSFLGNVQVFAQNTKSTTNKKKVNVNELIEKRCNRMASQMSLDDATTAKFIPLYKEYMQELRKCHANTALCNKNGELTDAERLTRMENRFDCRQKMLETQKSYYNKFKKILNARQMETLFCHRGHNATARKYYRGHNRHVQCAPRNGYQGQAWCDQNARAHRNCR